MRKNIYLLIIFIISLFFSAFLWDFINFKNVNNLIYGGEYYLKDYNPVNEIIRFIIFLIIPIATFLVSFIYFYSDKTYKFKEIIKINFFKTQSSNNLNFLFYLILLVLFIQFFILDFENLNYPLDIFHEGVWLTPSSNFLFTGNFWTSSFIERGLFGNFYPLILWEIFDKNSIGLSRFSNLLLLFSCKVFLLILAKQIALGTNFSDDKKLLFFFFLAILFTSLTGYFETEFFVKRSPLFLLFFNIFLFSLSKENQISLIHFFIGLFSVISFLWFIDIGAYLNVLIFLIIIFFTLRQNFKIVFSIIVGILLGWIIFYYSVSPTEFTHFVSGDARATKALIFLILAGIFVIYINLIKGFKFSNVNKIFFIFLYAASILNFKTGLGNSDVPHIKAAMAPTLLIIYTCVLYFIFNLIDSEKHLIFLKKFIKNKIFAAFFGVLILAALILNEDLIKIKNIVTTPKRINLLINYSDEVYLKSENSEYKDLINYYSKLSSKEDCIQILTDEVALPFLMKKKTCTKFIIMFIGAPDMVQKEFIKELTTNKPKIILLKTDIFKFHVPKEKMKLVHKYVSDNYTFHSKFKSWTFVVLNEES